MIFVTIFLEVEGHMVYRCHMDHLQVNIETKLLQYMYECGHICLAFGSNLASIIGMNIP